MKQTSYLPNDVAELFKNGFAYPEKLLFGSVATIQNDCPRIRTMRIYEVNEDGCPILLTHTKSNKWQEFLQNPQISISMVNESKLLQVLVSGRLTLSTSQSVNTPSQRYWNMVRADVKKIYDPRHNIEETYHSNDDLIIPQDIPNTFGIACLIPSFWETLQLDTEYTKSIRNQYSLKEGSWMKQRVHVG